MLQVQQPEFGRRLRELRNKKGLSQRAVAGDKINGSYISLLENGNRVPNLEVLLHLSDVLGVEPSELVDDGVLISKDSSSQLDRAKRRLVHRIDNRNSVENGNLGEAEAGLRSAFDEAKRTNDAIAALEFGFELGDVLRLRSDHRSRYALLREMRSLVEGVDSVELLTTVELDLAVSAREIGRNREALELSTAAVARLEQSPRRDVNEHVRGLGIMASIKSESSDNQGIITIVEKMLSISESVGVSPLTGRAAWIASIVYGRLGDKGKVLEYVRTARATLCHPQTPLLDWARFCRAAATTLMDTDADIAEIQAYVDSAREAARFLDLPDDHRRMAAIEAKFALAQSDYDRVVALTEDAPQDGPIGVRVDIELTRARALHALGRTAEATERLREVAAEVEREEAYRLATQLWREVAGMAQ